MIGIGVVTYNRLASLQACLHSIQTHTTLPHKLVVADDGSSDGTGPFLRSRRILTVPGRNVGVAGNKNRALQALRDCDHIFLIEDDARIVRPGWERVFITAQQATGDQHFSFCVCPHPNDTVRNEPGHNIIYRSMSNGYFLYLTQDVLVRVGGFDLRFGKYGYEHCDFTHRVFKAGLVRGENPHLVQSEPFIAMDGTVKSSISNAERDTWIAKNVPLYQKAQAEVAQGVVYRPIRVPDSCLAPASSVVGQKNFANMVPCRGAQPWTRRL